MSAPVLAPPPPAAAPAPPAPAPRRPPPAPPRRRFRDLLGAELAGRVAAFAFLALFANAHWVALLDPTPRGRALAVTLVALAAGLALLCTTLIGDRAVARATRLVVVLAGLAFGLVAAGLPPRLLSSENWDELGAGIADGIVAAGNVRPWPYGGEDAWLRQTVLLGAAPVTVLSALAAFWPARRGATIARSVGLALLVALFAVAAAAAEYDRGILRGLALFSLVAAWLWLPRLRGTEAVAAVAALAAVAGLSAVMTGKVASATPWVDYRAWSWSESSKSVAFEWQHEYGPLDWPRDGTMLLAVKAPEAHYWKAQSLDFFDGTRWTRLPFRDTRSLAGEIVQPDRRGWNEEIRFTVRGLRSETVVGAGLVYGTGGEADGAVSLTDGTYMLGGTLDPGDTYSVQAYVPDPSAREMRAAEGAFYEDWMRQYVTIGLPGPTGGQGLTQFPLRGSDASLQTDPRAMLTGTPYEEVYDLARRLAAGRRTAYDVVKATERYLEREYDYAERVPERRDPLPSFLFRDKVGYCQHFSGAMALLLRMNGIPARIAAGFTPGTFDTNTGEYRVRDYDAHSWVEVWFQGIGWVPFDPTPIAAPARAQGDSGAASAARGGPGDRVIRRDIFASGGSGGAADGGGTGPWLWAAVAAGLGLAAGAALLWRRARRPVSALGADVDYLTGLLVRLGFPLRPGVTLLALEDRIRRVAGPGAAGYVRRLSRARFGPGAERPPGAAERRELRRTLARAAGAGPLRRLQLALWSRTFRFGGP